MKTKILLVVFLFLCSKSYAQNTSDSLKNYLLQEMEKEKIPGLQIVVMKDNKIIISEAMGLANLEFSVPVENKTLFSINSITKVFSATAIMQLAEQKKIDISDPISLYLSDLPDDWKPVTIRQLLSHTSGLSDIEDSITGELIGNKGEDSAWIRLVKMPMQSVSGSEFSYNATNYLLLKKIIEKCSGTTFEEFIQKNQLDKAGMTKTLFGNSFDVVADKTPTYSFYDLDKSTGEYIKRAKLKQTYEEFPELLRADSGMFSTAEEIAQWIIALNSGKLLKNKKDIQTMWTPIPLINRQFGGFGGILNAYVLGWPVIQREQYPAVASIGGGRAAFIIYPENKLTIILLTNLTGCSPELIIDTIAKDIFLK